MPGSGPTPSIPLQLFNPGGFNMQPYGSGLGVGQATDFNGAVSGALPAVSGALAALTSGALAAAGYGSVASGLTAVTGTIGSVTNVTTQFAHFGTCPSGGGCQLPLPSGVPYPIALANYGVSGMSVFPPTVSGVIGAAASGTAYLQATGTTVLYSFFGGNQYGHSP